MQNLSKGVFVVTMVFFFLSIQGQVVINEYSAANLNNFVDSFDRTEDWIELYNTSEEAVDLSGWYLSDKVAKVTKWQMPVGTIIEGKGFLVFICSGRDGVFNEEYHTNFKLTQTKDNEVVQLADIDGIVMESHPLGITLVEHSICRTTDGAENWKICTTPSYGESNLGTEQYDGYTQTPTIEQEAGFYDSTLVVTIMNNDSSAILRYTIDGTNPTGNSREYTEPLEVSESTVVKARAYSNELLLPGKMDFKTFFVNESFTLPVFSVGADNVIELANGDDSYIPIGSLEYFNANKDLEAVAFGSLNRHGQDSWALDHRSLDWVTRDEMGYTKDLNAKLFGNSERENFQKFMFRNSGDDNYPAISDGFHNGSTHIRDEYVQVLGLEGGLELDGRSVERVIVFLNGQYWGVYGLRDRPVDHDYTDFHYGQGKYDLEYLTTWGTTELQYGGEKALSNWEGLRDFILDNDMSIPDNYKIAEDSLNMISLIDYFLINQNVVASDWLNYNTGWWRGLDPDGGHKKWGYIMWDLDATFDYYINYTGVPNISPDAEPCDIYAISDSIDVFFEQSFGFGGIDDPENCSTILTGECPYLPTDSIFLAVIEADEFCCQFQWDEDCEALYEEIETNGSVSNLFPECLTIQNETAPMPLDTAAFLLLIEFVPECCDSEWDETCQLFYDDIVAFTEDASDQIAGNVGKHEKILIKLLDESPDFKQLYYQRYADLMSTVFSCENMNTTLDSMLAIIEPEMPRQIDRWGGTLSQWERNVDRLKDFINERCELIGAGAVSCFDDLDGPYDLTLQVRPPGIGEIDLNTLDVEDLPWTGHYFGGVQNSIRANIFNEYEAEYMFSHWEYGDNIIVGPDVNNKRAFLELSDSDTLTAVFVPESTSVSELSLLADLIAYPNPTQGQINIEFGLAETADIHFELVSALGARVTDFEKLSGTYNAGLHQIKLSLDELVIPAGWYDLVLSIDGQRENQLICVLR